MEATFSEKLENIASAHQKVFRLNQSDALLKIGLEKAFSEKLWYIARIPWSSSAQAALAKEIAALEPADTATNAAAATAVNTPANATTKPAPKKLMVVDLDNTLWDGVVGEVGAQGIELSDEHTGLIYKDVQRQLFRMKDAGVLLAAASKNNEQDEQAPFRENAHKDGAVGSNYTASFYMFILSCRIMGKNIENFVVEQIEAWCKTQGINEIIAAYVPTKKNAPVKKLV